MKITKLRAGNSGVFGLLGFAMMASLLAGQAHAGRESSGGGLAVVCFNDPKTAEQVVTKKGNVNNNAV